MRRGIAIRREANPEVLIHNGAAVLQIQAVRDAVAVAVLHSGEFRLRNRRFPETLMSVQRSVFAILLPGYRKRFLFNAGCGSLPERRATAVERHGMDFVQERVDPKIRESAFSCSVSVQMEQGTPCENTDIHAVGVAAHSRAPSSPYRPQSRSRRNPRTRSSEGIFRDGE